MKKLTAIVGAVITALLCRVSAFAADAANAELPTGETMTKIYWLVGLMAAAVIAIAVLLIIRACKNKKDKDGKK